MGVREEKLKGWMRDCVREARLKVEDWERKASILGVEGRVEEMCDLTRVRLTPSSDEALRRRFVM